MNVKAIFLESVLTASGIPSSAKDAVEKAVALRQKTLEQSYLDFLDDQIHLCPRGEEWNTILKKRSMRIVNHGLNLPTDC